MIRALPGDPINALLGQSTRDIAPDQISFLRKELGLDKPLPVQYARWMGGWIGQGELGRSYHDNRPALEVILERVPATIMLVGLAMLLSYSLGVTWGIYLVWAKFKAKLPALEEVLVSITLFAYSTPAFLVALMAIYIATYFNFFSFIPIFRVNNLSGNHELLSLLPFVLLPAICLSIGRAAKVALFVRSLALDEMTKGYVTMAIAKGLSFSKVITFHVVRNCMIPIVNLLALQLPALFGGSVLIETIFGWPGTGRLAVEATFGRNYPVMTCLVMLYGTLVILSNLVADLVAPYVDPRLKDLTNSGKQEAMRIGQL